MVSVKTGRIQRYINILYRPAAERLQDLEQDYEPNIEKFKHRCISSKISSTH